MSLPTYKTWGTGAYLACKKIVLYSILYFKHASSPESETSGKFWGTAIVLLEPLPVLLCSVVGNKYGSLQENVVGGGEVAEFEKLWNIPVVRVRTQANSINPPSLPEVVTVPYRTLPYLPTLHFQAESKRLFWAATGN